MKRDIVNLGALTCVQASNAFAPLVIFPFVLRTLGSTAYADMVLGDSLSVLVLAVVVFSFDVTGVGDLVRLRHEGDQEAISRLFTSVLALRLALFIVAASVAIAFYTLVMGKSAIMISLWMLVPLAYVFQSVWLYQGYEENGPLAVFAIASRLGCVALIFVLVRDSLDGTLVPAIMGTTYLLGGLASCGYALRHHRLQLRSVPWDELIRTATEGKEIFFGNMAVTLQRDINVLILGLVGVPAQSLAAYSVAEKLTKSLQAVARPLNQLFFPKVVKAIRSDSAPSLEVARKIFRLTMLQVATMVGMLAVLTSCYFIVRQVSPLVRSYPNIDTISLFLAIMAPTTAFGIITFMFGSVGLNYLGRRKTYFGIILITGTTSATLCLILSPWIGAYGAVFCYAGAEIATALLVVSRYLHPAPQACASATS